MRFFFKVSRYEWLSLSLFFVVFFVFFQHTFYSSNGVLYLGSKLWSDFAATIPLIRSFSLGSNLPPEYPIFSGEPIRYHFIFFLIVALFEKLSLSIATALNLLSSVTFSLLLFSIYLIGKFIFKSRLTGIVSIILFLFNGSLSFFEFFKNKPLSNKSLFDIVANTQFPSFGPYDGKTVSAFWNLNIYTNQRHLAMAYFLYLIFSYYLWRNYKDSKQLSINTSIFIGFFVGVMPFIHMAVFGMMGISLIVYTIVTRNNRRVYIIGGIIALLLAIPQFFYMGTSANSSELIKLGYLVEELTVSNFLIYWVLNLGITLILFPIGFYLSDRRQKVFLLPFIILFAIGNLFRLSPEIAANHKFFNLFLIGINFYTAYLISKLLINKRVVAKLFGVLLVIPLTFSGFIDLFPIINDPAMNIDDYDKNLTAYYIYQNTPKDSVFLTSTFLYNPANLAGRKIFLGWPYFAWSAGYDTNSRDAELRIILNSTNKNRACSMLMENNIDYIILEPIEHNTELSKINYNFFDKNFVRIFRDDLKKSQIYDVNYSCQ